MVLIPSVSLYAQNTKDYYFEIKEGYELGEIQKALNSDHSLTLSMGNSELVNDLNAKQIFRFEKAFPESGNPKLQRVYFLTVEENTNFTTTLQRNEIEKIIPIDNETILGSDTNMNFGILPDDYEDIITGGRNTALDLIKAPLAWNITTGDPNVVIGVVDGGIDTNHEDLQGQVIEHVVISIPEGDIEKFHGTGVTGMIKEVILEMDNNLLSAWKGGGENLVNIVSTKDPKKRRIKGDNAKLKDIVLKPKERVTLYISFNFLIKEQTDKKQFVFYAAQRDGVSNELVGGETYIVTKKPRPVFIANGGGDKSINRSESVVVNASQINEAAIYNWYDPEGNLIYTGTDLTVAPEITTKYKLEVISGTDGFKDYDEVEVTVNPYYLTSLVPNPATQHVAINYVADGAVSSYLMVTSISTSVSNNYILNINDTNTTLDISTYSVGLYSVALVCDGAVVDSKTLAKQ